MSNLVSVAAGIAELQKQALAPFGPHTPTPVREDAILEGVLRAQKQKSQGQGGALELLMDGPRVTAALWAECHEHSFTGAPLTQLNVAMVPGCAEAQRFVTQHMASLVPRLSGDVHFECCDTYADMFPAFLVAGLFIESVKLVGLVADGIAYFSAHPVRLPHGFEIQAAQLSNIKEILEIYRHAYQRQHGWFLSTPEFLHKKCKDLQSGIGGSDRHWLVMRSSRAVGYCHVSLHDYANGIGGVEPVLLPESRGRGVGTFLYQEAMRILADQNHRSYIGNTSHPMVMRLATKLRRQRVATSFRTEKFFEPEHFELESWKQK